MIKNVIFDCDGVLLASNDVFYDCFVECAKKIDVEVTRDFYIRVTGGGMFDSIKVFSDMYGVDETTAEKIILEVDQLYKDKVKTEVIPLMPYVNEILDDLEAQGIKKYIASSSYHAVIESTLKPHHLLERFDGSIFGDMVKERKPSPEIYLTCIEKYNMNKDETIIIEDSMNGIIAAHRAGVKCIGVPDFSPVDEWVEKGFCIKKENLKEAMNYIRKENQS